jgi:hypothetical protein
MGSLGWSIQIRIFLRVSNVSIILFLCFASTQVDSVMPLHMIWTDTAPIPQWPLPCVVLLIIFGNTHNSLRYSEVPVSILVFPVGEIS